MFRSLLLLVIVLLTGCASQRPAEVVDKSMIKFTPSGAYRYIVVAAGDTVSSLSTRYQVPGEVIKDLNNLHGNKRLIVGRTLIIPSERYHKVLKGQTIFEIATIYGVLPVSIVGMNSLEFPYELQAGVYIRIPSKNYITTSKIILPQGRQKRQGFESDEADFIEDLEIPIIIDDDSDQDFVYLDDSLSDSTSPKHIDTTSHNSGELSFALPNPMGSKNFIWPVKGDILRKYGNDGVSFHEGINIKAPFGSPVLAAGDGIVEYIGSSIGGYGKLVILKHKSGYMTAYAHNSDIMVSRGMKVSKGDVIAKIGQSGGVSEPQLHFAVKQGNRTIDPEKVP